MQPTILTTDSGVRFGSLNPLPNQPAPTIFMLAVDIETTLEGNYSLAGQILARRGYLCVTLDVPGHGQDADPAEGNALVVWSHRIDCGETPISDFAAKVSRVLDYLIANNHTDPDQVAVCGTSRGGFLAAHVAAADSRYGYTAQIAPVTDLRVLTEFQDAQRPEAVEVVSLSNVAARLAGRPLWTLIGNYDQRVDTDSVIAFTRSVVRASVAAGLAPDVELHVVTSEGHSTPADTHEMVANWLLARMNAR